MQILSLIKMEILWSTVSHPRGRRETCLLLSELLIPLECQSFFRLPRDKIPWRVARVGTFCQVTIEGASALGRWRPLTFLGPVDILAPKDRLFAGNSIFGNSKKNKLLLFFLIITNGFMHAGCGSGYANLRTY